LLLLRTLQALQTLARRTRPSSLLDNAQVTPTVHLGAAASTVASVLVPSSLRQGMGDVALVTLPPTTVPP